MYAFKELYNDLKSFLRKKVDNWIYAQGPTNPALNAETLFRPVWDSTLVVHPVESDDITNNLFVSERLFPTVGLKTDWQSTWSANALEQSIALSQQNFESALRDAQFRLEHALETARTSLEASLNEMTQLVSMPSSYGVNVPLASAVRGAANRSSIDDILDRYSSPQTAVPGNAVVDSSDLDSEKSPKDFAEYYYSKEADRFTPSGWAVYEKGLEAATEECRASSSREDQGIGLFRDIPNGWTIYEKYLRSKSRDCTPVPHRNGESPTIVDYIPEPLSRFSLN